MKAEAEYRCDTNSDKNLENHKLICDPDKTDK